MYAPLISSWRSRRAGRPRPRVAYAATLLHPEGVGIVFRLGMSSDAASWTLGRTPIVSCRTVSTLGKVAIGLSSKEWPPDVVTEGTRGRRTLPESRREHADIDMIAQ
ncbi:hypothetical protein BD309DRAFT_965148 [Dichomitus squalens]|nr:hypothetical protein BD309DRAFT_965148 [Dichomitus squalens]